MYEILKHKLGTFRFRLKDNEGNILLRSSGYTQKTNCKKGISSVKKNTQKEERIELISSYPFGYRIILKSGNYRIIATSEVYKSEIEAKNSIKKVMSIGDIAFTLDLTK